LIHKIAHRGNTKGKTLNENMPTYVLNACDKYFVEIDVWFVSGRFYLGHDNPEYEVEDSFLSNDKFFCHAKNEEALHEMIKKGIHCFWHEDDKMTVTSKGFVWKYPEVYKDGVLWGICSDRL
jgi:hypothetical protein